MLTLAFFYSTATIHNIGIFTVPLPEWWRWRQKSSKLWMVPITSFKLSGQAVFWLYFAFSTVLIMSFIDILYESLICWFSFVLSIFLYKQKPLTLCLYLLCPIHLPSTQTEILHISNFGIYSFFSNPSINTKTSAKNKLYYTSEIKYISTIARKKLNLSTLDLL